MAAAIIRTESELLHDYTSARAQLVNAALAFSAATAPGSGPREPEEVAAARLECAAAKYVRMRDRCEAPVSSDY